MLLHTVHENSFGSPRVVPFIRENEPLFSSGKRSVWKEELLSSLCRYIGCSFVYKKEGKIISCFLIGRKPRIEACRVIWNNLISLIENKASNLRGYGKSAFNSYYLGFVSGINSIVAQNVSEYGETAMIQEEAKFYANLSLESFYDAPESIHAQVIDSVFNDGKMFGIQTDLKSLVDRFRN